jgi:zinc transporter 9
MHTSVDSPDNSVWRIGLVPSLLLSLSLSLSLSSSLSLSFSPLSLSLSLYLSLSSSSSLSLSLYPLSLSLLLSSLSLLVRRLCGSFGLCLFGPLPLSLRSSLLKASLFLFL